MSQNPVSGLSLVVAYTIIVAITGALSQLTISPVYGSIPAAAQHTQVLRWALLVGFIGKDTIRRYIPFSPGRLMPIAAFYIPVIQNFLFKDSEKLGCTMGPIVTEALSYFPIALLSACCISDGLETISFFRRVPVAQTAVGVAIYFALTFLEPNISKYLSYLIILPNLPIPSMLLTQANLQMVTASLTVALAPSWMGLLAIPAVIHTTKYNTHLISEVSNPILNATLFEQGWQLLDRQQSNTGYVSVLESLEQQYRVLRCDHSLLGGEWLVTKERTAEGVTVSEPIYSVFEMLEAVRLVEDTGNTKKDKDKRALVIGLGIGTAPKALMAHGVDTTIVELDPVVHKYAMQYFGLPNSHTSILMDAVKWAEAAATPETFSPVKYDFIIHDVFTGGAEPLPLFTQTFISDLRSILARDGVIAINYAGDWSLRPTKQVLNTINKIFEGQCRVFRDLAPEDGGDDSDFTNMVIFCTNPASGKRTPITFRQPVEADFLSSQSRQHYLLPRKELEMRFPDDKEMAQEEIQILTIDNIGKFSREQLNSAKRHWEIMRKVLPAFVWENW